MTQSGHIFNKCNDHCACAVSRDFSGDGPHFEILDHHLSTLKVHCACNEICTCSYRFPKTTRNNFL